VLEFNCRFGDPETQALLPRLKSNFGELLLACVEGNLSHHRLVWEQDSTVAIVLASAGYPGSHQTGNPISGLQEAAEVQGAQVFHAGTVAREGRVLTAGGRVLTVMAMAHDLDEARRRAYEAASKISFDGMTYRRDIAELAPQEAR
jgi:phosphoribosylamine--glycine ligase